MSSAGLSLLTSHSGVWAWGANLHYLYLIRIVRRNPLRATP